MFTDGYYYRRNNIIPIQFPILNSIRDIIILAIIIVPISS